MRGPSAGSCHWSSGLPERAPALVAKVGEVFRNPRCGWKRLALLLSFSPSLAFERTNEYAARNRGEAFDRLQYATLETLHLSPLPCWKHLPEDLWRARSLNLDLLG